MTTTDLTAALEKPSSTELVIADEQTGFTPAQRTALAHMGVEDAPEGDLAVFFHVVKRSGLDPFARQIYMIGRNSYNPRTRGYETKYTIQTGIDGYRLIGRRAADMHGHTVAVAAPEWLRSDGAWMPAWSRDWGAPIAARVTITRDGQPFTAVANFEEYAQTVKDKEGGRKLNSMWEQRPAGQIAKCAEALAWRMSFPQDMAGIYVDAEMDQAAGTRDAVAGRQRPKVTAATFTQASGDANDVVEGEEVADEPPTQDALADMWRAFDECGYPEARTPEGKAARLSHMTGVLGREVTSSQDLTAADVAVVAASIAGGQ